MERIFRPRLCSNSSSPVVKGEDGASSHISVLESEVIDNLVVKSSGVYIDATFGRGGHVKRILQQLDNQGIIVCIDKDPEAIQVAEAINDPRLVIRQGSFIKLKQWVDELKLMGKVDGVLLDLGVSSPQLDDPKRGFSFMQDGPLDMRMDPNQKLSAAVWVNKAKESEIAAVLWEFGEERFSRRIAKAIVSERELDPILTTRRLAEIVSAANPRWEKHKNPATRTFQAIRIFVNSELDELKECLEQCLQVLKVGGRLLVISFHSLEDRIVKRFVQRYSTGSELPIEVPIIHEQLRIRLRKIGRAIRAGEEEINRNPRARSAILRVMEKVT